MLKDTTPHPTDALPLPEPDFIVFDADGFPVPVAYTDAALRAAHRRGYALVMSEDTLANTQRDQQVTTPRDGDKILMIFYGVADLYSLIDAMDKHIEALQAKLPRNDQPAFTRVREG